MRKYWTRQESSLDDIKSPRVKEAIKLILLGILATTNDFNDDEGTEFTTHLLRLVTMMKTIEERVDRGEEME